MRQYKIARSRPSDRGFMGYVRFRRWYGWSKWECFVCDYESTPAQVEAKIDQYEAEQPDSYFYTPKAPA